MEFKEEETKLLPCPFCGGDAIRIDVEAHTHVVAVQMPDYDGGTFIECSKCSAATSSLDDWNTRHTPEFTDEEIEAAARALAMTYLAGRPEAYTQEEIEAHMLETIPYVKSEARSILQAFAAVRMKGEG